MTPNDSDNPTDPTDASASPRPIEAALACARRNWPVFPVHSIRDGRCSCGKPKCSNPGKHPRTRNGFKDATTDTAKIRAWWKKWPEANVAIATGKASGVVVLDVDPRNGGHVSLGILTDEHGPIPFTVEAITGGGGWHIAFAHPGIHIGCRTGIQAGLDFKGDGGYIIVEPSTHISGRRYAWELSHSPDDTPLAPLPAWLLDLVEQRDHAEPGRPSDQSESGSRRGREGAERAQAGGTERTEPGRNGETERDRETEKNRDAEQPSNDCSNSLYSSVLSVLSAISVLSVSSETVSKVVDAINVTAPIEPGVRNRAVFAFARHVKAIPRIAQVEIGRLRPLLKIWHQVALPTIGTKPFADTWMDFVNAYPQVKFPKGDEPMAQIAAAAESASSPACAAQYDSPDAIRLIKLCRQLQLVAGDGPFFISGRMAGQVLDIDHQVAWKMFKMLCADGILRIEQEATTTRATRYRYLGGD